MVGGLNAQEYMCADSQTGPSSSGEKDAASARTTHSIPPACGIFYYEVEILGKEQKS